MAGNRYGGLKAAATNKAKHGDDFYRNIGHKGGTANHPDGRGFSSRVRGRDGLTGPERAKLVGKKGGGKIKSTIKRRTKYEYYKTNIEEAVRNGKSTVDIATELGISKTTVYRYKSIKDYDEFHEANKAIYKKLKERS